MKYSAGATVTQWVCMKICMHTNMQAHALSWSSMNSSTCHGLFLFILSHQHSGKGTVDGRNTTSVFHGEIFGKLSTSRGTVSSYLTLSEVLIFSLLLLQTWSETPHMPLITKVWCSRCWWPLVSPLVTSKAQMTRIRGKSRDDKNGLDTTCRVEYSAIYKQRFIQLYPFYNNLMSHAPF